MKYKKVVEGIFLKRPNRFIAQVLIDGQEETVHVKNTGRCRELLIPGVKVLLEDGRDNPNRKTKHSLISVWKGDMLINMDSQAPNAAACTAIKENRVKEIQSLTHLKREVTFGKSRFDLYFETLNNGTLQKGFIEVKGVTLENEGICMFPDAPTERGTKHVLEMVEAVKQGYRGILLFVIQMKGPNLFKLNWEMDRAFSQAVQFASENGVEVLAYDAVIEKDEIILGDRVDIDYRA